MSLLALVTEIQQEAKAKRQQEREILQEIAAITSLEFAEQAAEALDSRKRAYSFDGYLVLLERLKRLIAEDVPNCQALEMVQTGETAETLLSIWQAVNKGYK